MLAFPPCATSTLFWKVRYKITIWFAPSMMRPLIRTFLCSLIRNPHLRVGTTRNEESRSDAYS